MGQNNTFSYSRWPSPVTKPRDSFSDNDSSLTESKHRRSSKMTRRIRDHHRQRVEVRRLSPSPDFRSFHAKRITNKKKIDSDLASTYSSGDNRDHLLKRGYVRKSSSSPNSSVRRSVHSRRVSKKTKRHSDLTSTSSIEGIYSIYKQGNSFKKSRQRRDHHRQSRSSPDYTVNARRRRDSSSEFSDSSSIIARKKARRWLNYNNFNECPPEFEESFIEEKNYTDEGTFETNFDLDPRKGNYYLKDTKNDSAYNSNQSDAHYKEDEEQIDLKQGNLRPIIIDGANIGHQWGRNRFSAMGYKIVYDHFKKEFGYPDDKIVIVHKHIPSEHLLDEDWAIIKDFKQTGILINAPSRIVGDGETLIQSDDDVFCLKIAHTHGGIGKKYFHFLIKSLLNRNRN